MDIIVLLFLHNSFFSLVKGTERRIKRWLEMIGDPNNVAVVCMSSFYAMLLIKLINNTEAHLPSNFSPVTFVHQPRKENIFIEANVCLPKLPKQTLDCGNPWNWAGRPGFCNSYTHTEWHFLSWAPWLHTGSMWPPGPRALWKGTLTGTKWAVGFLSTQVIFVADSCVKVLKNKYHLLA